MNKINRTVLIDDKEISYVIERKKIKRMYLRIKDDRAYVTCGLKINIDLIDDLVIKNYYSLYDKVSSKISLKYNDDTDFIRIKGKIYPLIIINEDGKYIFNNSLKIYSKNGKDIVQKIDAFLIDITKKSVEEIINNNYELFKRNNILPKSISYKKMKSRWGYCTYPDNDVVFNSFLGMLEDKFTYYLVCHELCHIKYPNHGKNFHLLLENLCPNHRKISQDLKEYVL